MTGTAATDALIAAVYIAAAARRLLASAWKATEPERRPTQ